MLKNEYLHKKEGRMLFLHLFKKIKDKMKRQLS